MTRSVIRQEGVLALWRGTTPTIARNVPGVAAYFYSVTTLRSILASAGFSKGQQVKGARPKLRPEADMAAGAIARVGVGGILMPVTLIKTRSEVRIYVNATNKRLNIRCTAVYPICESKYAGYC